MKTTKEMIEVMSAYEEGKKIETRYIQNGNWFNSSEPRWNWDIYDYRVKEEPVFRPYKDTEEMINDFCERFGVKRTNFGEPFIWVKTKNEDIRKCLITEFYLHSVILGSDNEVYNLSDLFDYFTYLDGSPCGKLKN